MSLVMNKELKLIVIFGIILISSLITSKYSRDRVARGVAGLSFHISIVGIVISSILYVWNNF